MSSLHNDLDTWAGKSRARGDDRIEILNDTANEIAELLREHQQLRDAMFKPEEASDHYQGDGGRRSTAEKETNGMNDQFTAPAVKQLEWHYRDGQQFYTYYTEELGRAVYWINQQFGSDSFYFTTMTCLGITLYDGDDLPSAKAAAQADYEARIHAALASPPSPTHPQLPKESAV